MIRLKLLTAALAFLAACVTVWLAQGAEESIATRDLAGLLLFLLINGIAESKPLALPTLRGSHVEITISGLCAYAMVALFPPFAAAVTGASAVLVSEVFIKRKSALKSCFNGCQTFLSMAAASQVYAILSSHPVTSHISPQIPALTAAVATYFVVNTGLVSLALSSLQRTSFLRTWLDHYGWEVLYVVGSVPVALLLVAAYDHFWLAGPLLFVAPLFLLREAYAQYVRLKTNYTETVRTLVKVIETHDAYTAGHSSRVAEYAKRVATALRLRPSEIERVEIAAYLHDLGKVDLAITNLVRKAGALTEEERSRIELHPIVSAELAAQVTLFRGEIESTVRYHHENHDGSGYPYGLSGDEIPLGARILHVVDVFDAMISSRTYRPAIGFEEVRTEMRGNGGTQFDPEVLAVFLDQCMTDESMVLPQVEPEYELKLAESLREAARIRLASRTRRRSPAPAIA